ncbi:hypothetical protein PGIGA_G00159050 [Pangasianodon gigas]|uniref:Uncharacterized protein n=1 Tax=Pangasianodon gigas TaxID=30993 RepID=A0ACC5XR32_PANGG|nr:hypothetical protein [Pangasianodon gigas]
MCTYFWFGTCGIRGVVKHQLWMERRRVEPRERHEPAREKGTELTEVAHNTHAHPYMWWMERLGHFGHWELTEMRWMERLEPHVNTSAENLSEYGRYQI